MSLLVLLANFLNRLASDEEQRAESASLINSAGYRSHIVILMLKGLAGLDADKLSPGWWSAGWLQL
jgi:hypothetical protein